jgi:hypothetical protein
MVFLDYIAVAVGLLITNRSSKQLQPPPMFVNVVQL